MNSQQRPKAAAGIESRPAHALNNLLGKILAAAELALDRVEDPQAQAHLQTIMTLAEAGGATVRSLHAALEASADTARGGDRDE